MKFEFNAEKENYEHFSAGRVLVSQVGATAFPVRLASEIFQVCYAYLAKARLRVYDPCCGTAYLLTTLGLLHPEALAGLYGSDIDGEALELAQKNLALLSTEGLLVRRAELERLYALYGKSAHADALVSCDVLLQSLPATPLTGFSWLGDATHQQLAPACVDLLLCDVPYGLKAQWETTSADPIYQLLDAHYPSLASGGMAVIISDKQQKAVHPAYRRFKQLQHGKRRITMLVKGE